MGGARGDEESVGGRVGRFNRKFEGMGGLDVGEFDEGVSDAAVDSKTKKGGK